MVLFLREASVQALVAQHPHRPLFGLLLGWAAKAFGTRPGPYVAMATLLWAVLAWQSAKLCRRLLPTVSAAAPLAAMLTLSPILVSTQYTTATTVLPANLPVSLVLAALLLVLTDAAPGVPILATAATLVGVSVLLSEYGIAAAAGAVALLAVERRFRPAVALVLGTAAGYALFRATADLSVRVKQSPSAQLGTLLGHPFVAILRFFEGLWLCLAGAWGEAAGAVRFSIYDRSTLLAALVGVGAAAVFFVLTSVPEGAFRSVAFENRAGAALVAAVAAGILPVVVANRSLTSSDPYETRYLLPVLPFAAAAVALGLVRITSPRGRRFVFAAVAFVAGYRVVAGAFETRQEQQRMDEIGALVHPLVRDSSGITVAVVPDRWKLGGSDVTPKVTWRWNDADARRVWVMPASEAAEVFGARGRCHGTDAVALAPELMSTPRVGPLSHLVWLSAWGRTLGELEPYCLGPVR